ncbi:MAG: hypothetical protein ACYC0W_10910 [Candidatus Nanopelagicales bacterium]
MAIGVPDLEFWAARWETFLGPGFEVMTVSQATGEFRVAIHPAGVELIEVLNAPAALRSFHLAVPSLDEVDATLDEVGWDSHPGPVVAGRRHRIVDASGLRVLLVETSRA